VFEPAAQRVLTSGTLVARSDGDPTSMLPVLRQAVAALDPNLALAEVRTMDAVRSESAARQRFLTILLAAFAAIGVALAVVGVYGVMAQVARRRTREMGIRIALGAQAPALQWLVVQRGLVLTVTGVAIGLVAALATTGLLRALLFNVEPLDPWTLGMVPVLLTVAGLAATWLPAMRASRSDPIQSLRQGD
jgi:ABC-type antimicrobial peptide transport system permease subunit